VETIKHAAVVSESGWVFIGKCHADCFHKMHHLTVKSSQKAANQGFVTSTGRYVDRHEGAKLAYAAGQVDKLASHLFSEDLWCERYEGKFKYDEIKGYVRDT